MEYLQKAFDKKYVFCGDYCYLKEYSKPHLLGIKRSENAVKGKDNESGKLKRYDNLKRARDSVAQIVYSNLTPHTKFLTLTTAETVLEIPEFQRKLQTFLQQMKRNGFKLKYIYVYERQLERGKKEGNKGCLHVHMIVFNDEYIPMDIIKKCWHYGRVELKILNGLRCKDNKTTNELIRNPASYICKYITKESVAEWNEKVFRCSKDIERPIEINNEIYVHKDSVGITTNSEELQRFFNDTYTVFYENAKTIRYTTDRKTEQYFQSVSIGRKET